MSIEIERKFLSEIPVFYNKKRDIQQGYLFVNTGISSRVRIIDDKAYQTTKIRIDNMSNNEIEVEISVDDAQLLMKHCKHIITKTRYEYTVDGLNWEVDEFHGANKGLILAEIELTKSTQVIDIPPFILEEVTGNAKYYNCNMKSDIKEKEQ